MKERVGDEKLIIISVTVSGKNVELLSINVFVLNMIKLMLCPSLSLQEVSNVCNFIIFMLMFN